MQRVVRSVGYVALLATAATLLGGALLAPAQFSIAGVGVSGGLVLVGAVTATVERRQSADGLGEAPFETSDGVDVVAVTAAAGLAYALSVHAGLGPVLASALVGVGAAVATPDVDTAAYCGSFVGMASPAVFPSVEAVLVAGFASGVAFVAAKEAFVGFGGKLGTLALFGCVVAGPILGVEYATTAGLDWGNAVLTIPTAAVAAVVTAVLSVRFDLGAVLGSGLVGVAAGVAFPVVAPDVGGLLATVAFCASFVGMSTRDRLGTEVGIGLAGALCGLVFVVVAPAFDGAGGKLGTTAFIACVAVAGADRLLVDDWFSLTAE